MKAAHKKSTWAFSVLFVLPLLAPITTQAQSYGGGSVSSLYGASNASVFQAPASTQQGGSSAQVSNATLLQTTGITVLAVTGAPVPAASTDSTNDMNSSNEILLLSVFAGLFALGVLYLLSRQIKKS